MRFKHYSIRTEEAYLSWIRRFILFHGKRHPELLGTEEVRAFLRALAVEGKVAAATQNQALSALLFLYQQVLKKEIGWLKDVERRNGRLSCRWSARPQRCEQSSQKCEGARCG